ncbi:hypothetical protein EVAR_79119_1 [Eumeta japonica]|uniref:Uncharacterized protein n=1 Tax=Eumeta variegata TaxID=151549 RepID=A0A4C1T7Q1_EUMVA|nr:hypothetical protein EVAR_79119_1 [Eumeta japonica]
MTSCEFLSTVHRFDSGLVRREKSRPIAVYIINNTVFTAPMMRRRAPTSRGDGASDLAVCRIPYNGTAPPQAHQKA